MNGACNQAQQRQPHSHQTYSSRQDGAVANLSSEAAEWGSRAFAPSPRGAPADGQRSQQPSHGGRDADSCSSEEQILAFVEGRLSESDVLRLDHHLGKCPVCEALVVEALNVCGLNRVAKASFSARDWLLEPGTCLASRYVIGGYLGQGGMGEVYEAFDVKSRRRVAIKTARATGCDDPDVSRRLSTEARLARRVRHPNVCRVYGAGVHRDARPNGGQLGFISMEFIDGESVAQYLRRHPMPVDQLAVVGREMLLGIAGIHQAGVIHRDIKSHNIMLRMNASAPVAIVDFGLAVEVARAPRERLEAYRWSSSRTFEGSPAYMAPEQFWGSVVTPATDVFAAAVVLFQALTGSLPFRAFRSEGGAGARRDPAEVPLRARSVAAHVPEHLDAFIAACLEVDPRHRYPDALTALEAFDNAIGGC